VELIDEVAFIQALTLVAIAHESAGNQDEDIDDDEANARIDDDDEEEKGESYSVNSRIKCILEMLQRIAQSE
jgi:hypothetical protein